MYDFQALTERAAQVAGITERAAHHILDDYITQLEQTDSRTIDRDQISDDDAGFLTEAIRQAQRAGDLGTRQLAALEEQTQRVQDAHDHLADEVGERDLMIRTALAHGARVKDVMSTTGLSRQRINQIERGTR